MKKFLLVIFLVLLLPSILLAAAAGTVTQTVDKYMSPDVNMRILTFTWTASADDGSVPPTATSAVNTSDIIGWYVYAIETNPGAVAPTASYDIVVNDAEGLDIAGGMLANRSASATEKSTPRLDSTYSIFGGVLIDGALTLVITGQSVHSATGTVKLIMSR